VVYAYRTDDQVWAAPLIHFGSGMRPRSLRWGRTGELMELASYSREFLREEGGFQLY